MRSRQSCLYPANFPLESKGGRKEEKGRKGGGDAYLRAGDRSPDRAIERGGKGGEGGKEKKRIGGSQIPAASPQGIVSAAGTLERKGRKKEGSPCRRKMSFPFFWAEVRRDQPCKKKRGGESGGGGEALYSLSREKKKNKRRSADGRRSRPLSSSLVSGADREGGGGREGGRKKKMGGTPPAGRIPLIMPFNELAVSLREEEGRRKRRGGRGKERGG